MRVRCSGCVRWDVLPETIIGDGDTGVQDQNGAATVCPLRIRAARRLTPPTPTRAKKDFRGHDLAASGGCRCNAVVEVVGSYLPCGRHGHLRRAASAGESDRLDFFFCREAAKVRLFSF